MRVETVQSSMAVCTMILSVTIYWGWCEKEAAARESQTACCNLRVEDGETAPCTRSDGIFIFEKRQEPMSYQKKKKTNIVEGKSKASQEESAIISTHFP
jgi:hypothetical protein